MQRSIKIRLKPTSKQESLFWQSAGVSRWAYNYFLAENEKRYKEYLEKGEGSKSISEGAFRKHINNDLKPTTHTWLKNVGSNVMKQAVKDADLARKRWFNGISDKPKFKSRHKTKPSFYVNYESLRRMNHGFRGEKIGFVKTTKQLPTIPKGAKYSNPRISYDGNHWYLSIGYKIERKSIDLTGESIGVDLGIKELAVTSQGVVYKNINKTKQVKKLERKLKREQRKLSRKQLSNIKKYDKNRKPIWERPLKECRNIQKQHREINLLYKKLTNIRQNYLHQTTTEIVKAKPSRIVVEDLNVKGMMKNRHLSKAIAQQKFYEFVRQIKYKCEEYGIEFVKADRFYPSSKLCSECGHKKTNLKLSDRIYHCRECGHEIDRDLNAALNLASYLI